MSVRDDGHHSPPMDAVAANRLVDQLADAYPLTPPTEGTRALYVRYLADLDARAAQEAMTEIILDSPTLPMIAEIRRKVIERDVDIPTPLEAWAAIVGPRPGGEAVDFHPVVREICNLFGGTYTIRNSDEPTIMRAQFLKAYAERRDEELRRENLGRFRRAA